MKLEKLKETLSKNAYQQKFTDKYIFIFLNKISEHKQKTYNGSKEGTHNCSPLFRKYVEY